jgi:hypothetical protein
MDADTLTGLLELMKPDVKDSTAARIVKLSAELCRSGVA